MAKDVDMRLDGYDRDVFLLASGMFLRRLVQGFLQVVRTIYLALIGFDPIAIGLITGVGSAVSIVESALFGTLSDRYGRKLFLAMGSIMSSIRMFLYALSRDFWILMVAQGIGALGEGEGAGQPVVSGYIADKVGDGVKRTSIFSLVAITNALASTLGSLLAAMPAYLEGALRLSIADAHIPLFWIGFILSAASIVPIAFMKEHRGDASKKPPKLPITSPMALREIALYSLVRSTDGLAMGFVSSLAPLYLYLRFGAGSEDLAPVYAVARFIPIPLYLAAPRVIEKLGYVTPLIILRTTSGLMALCIAIAWDFRFSSLFLVLYMTLVEIGMPVRQAFATEIVGSSAVGSLIGVSNSIRTLVRSIAPIVAGYLFEISQFYLPFAIGSSLFFVNSFQFYAFYSHRQKGYGKAPVD
ncbi:MAG: MFS transporter [Candidatus Bathyarchaeia archaeon]